MDDICKKKKIVKRIVKHSVIYKNNFDELMQFDLQKLSELQLKLLIGLKIKLSYKTRHKNQ